MEEHFLYNNSIIIAMGVLMLGAVLYGIYTINKKNPGMNPGEILSSLAVDQHETVFMFGIIALGIGDAVIVASTHTAINSIQMNPFGRIMLHGAAFVIETVASVTLVRDIAACFMKQEWRWRSWKIATTLGISIAVFFVPLWTLDLAASNLGADFEWDMYKYSIDPRVSAQEWKDIVKYYNLEPDGKPYRPFDHVPLPLKLLMFSAMLRLLGLFIEGGRNIGSPARSRMLFARIEKELADENKRLKDLKDEASKKKEEGEKKEGPKEVKDNVRYLLSRLGYKGDNLNKFVELASKAIDKISEQDIQAGMAVRIAQLVDQGNAIKGISDENKKKDANKKLEADIIKLFNDPVSPNRGSMTTAEYVKAKGLGLSVKKNPNN